MCHYCRAVCQKICRYVLVLPERNGIERVFGFRSFGARYTRAASGGRRQGAGVHQDEAGCHLSASHKGLV